VVSQVSINLEIDKLTGHLGWTTRGKQREKFINVHCSLFCIQKLMQYWLGRDIEEHDRLALAQKKA
jgi:hypothetical protein